MKDKEFKYVSQDDKKVYFKGEKQEWEEDLLKYRESKEHSDDCAAYSDGCLCCLDREWIWKFIERITNDKSKCDHCGYKQIATSLKQLWGDKL